MQIQRSEKKSVEVVKQVIDTLGAGTVFKVGKKLYLKTDGYNEAARLTTGEIDTFDSNDVADEVVEGTFSYA